MAFSRKAFVNFLLPLIGLLLVAAAIFVALPSASAYSSCTPGATCDTAGQACTYFLPTDSLCRSTLSCTSYNQSQTRTVPYDTACFCMQNLEITSVNDESLAGSGAESLFRISVRQSNLVKYRQETTYSNLLLFNSGDMVCTGCKYNNPSCGSNQYCDTSRNVCIYNQPTCKWYEELRNGQCRLLSGYCYSDGDCGGDEVCSDNTCRYQYCDHNCGYLRHWNGNTCVSDWDYDYDSCSDSGSYVWGYNSGSYYSHSDYCSGNTLTEYYCSGTGYASTTEYCTNGCSNGACNSGSTGSCYDSDGGLSPDTYGYVQVGSSTYYDTCLSDGITLAEGVCQNGQYNNPGYSCTNGCSNGKCNSGSSTSCTNDYCQSTYGSNYYCNANGQCQYQAPSNPSGGYTCSAGEKICGIDCYKYYYLSSTCTGVVKDYCIRYGITNPEVSNVNPCNHNLGGDNACVVRGYLEHNDLQISAETNQFCKNDPPVDCKAYLTGPGLSRTYVGAYPFDVLPNLEYTGVVHVNQSYFKQQGTYSMDVVCNIELPSGSVACTSGCDSAGATVNFHVDTCNTAISVETDKYQYASGEMMTINGKIRNNNLPIGTTVYVRIQDLLGNTQATIPVSASGGEFSTNWIVPSSLSSGSYRINATAQFNSCPQAASNVVVALASCDVTVASAFSQKGFASPASVSGTVYNHGTPLSAANVTVKIFKDGNLYKQAYVGSLLDGTYTLSIPGPFGDGTYSSQVDAKYLSCPVVSSYATGASTFAGTCDLRLVNGAAKFSSTASGVQVTGYLADGNGTRVSGTYTIEVRDKAGATVGSASGVSTSSGDISASIANVPAGDYDVTVKSQSGSCASTDKLSLGGDFTVSLYSSPSCGTTSGTYQIKLKNSQQSSTTVTVTYSSISQVTLSGPTSVSLSAGEEKIISVTAAFADGFSGGSLGVVNFNNGNSASSQALEIPICASVSGSIHLNLVDKLRSAAIGQRVCYAMQVENRGPDSGTVTMSYDSGPYYVGGSFNFQQYRLSSYETRDDLSFCATVPNAQFYTIPIVIRANAPFGTATDTVALSSGASSSDISIGFSGCPNIAIGVQYPITLYNNGETANYAVEVTDNGYLHPIVSPPVINNFARYSSQIVTVSVNPTGLLSANYVTLYIRKDGTIVKQQQLCFATIGAKNASSQYASSLYAINRSTLSQSQSSNTPDVTIYAPQIDYSYNGTYFIANASFLVKNNEDRALLYEADVSLPEGWQAQYYPRAATIRSGDMREFTVAMSTDNFQKRVYQASIAIVDPIGRTASAPFSIDATNVEPGTGILTGFFSAAGFSGYGLAIAVLLVIGAVLFYGIRMNEEAAA